MPYNACDYMKGAKQIPKHFIFANLDDYYLTDTLLQEPLSVPSGGVAILQIWIKETNGVALVQCYINSNAERIEAGSKNCSIPMKSRIDSWLREFKSTASQTSRTSSADSH